jgi:hypothetical protein
MNFTKRSLPVLMLFSFMGMGSCGNSSSGKSVANEAVSQTSQPEQTAPLSNKSSKIQSDLDKAKQEGKAVFVVVTGTGVTETDKATTIAKGANELYKNATVVQLDRDDAANSQQVAEWRLAGAPLPLVLVVSPKGFLTGGMILSQATAENIAALVPSPRLEDVYAAIGAGKTALVVFTKKSLGDRTEVLEVCKEAVKKLNNNATIIEVDVEDSKEVNFINQLRIDKATTASTTLVINAQGQVAGTSTTIPDAEKLVAAATTPVRGGCGPGCGPAGCGK